MWGAWLRGRVLFAHAAGVGRAEVAWVVSQATPATFFLLLPSPCPCASPQWKQASSLMGTTPTKPQHDAPCPFPEHPRAPRPLCPGGRGRPGPPGGGQSPCVQARVGGCGTAGSRQAGRCQAALKQSTRVEAGAEPAGMAGGAAILGAGRTRHSYSTSPASGQRGAGGARPEVLRLAPPAWFEHPVSTLPFPRAAERWRGWRGGILPFLTQGSLRWGGGGGMLPAGAPALPAAAGDVRGAGTEAQPARVPCPPGMNGSRTRQGQKTPPGEEGRGWRWDGGRQQGHGCPPQCHRQRVGVSGQGGAVPQVSQAGSDAKGPCDGHRPPATAGVGTATRLGTARPSGHLRVPKGGGTPGGSPHPVPGERSLCSPSRPPQTPRSPREQGLAGTFPCASSLRRRPPRSVPHCPRRRPVTPGARTMSRLTGQGQAGSPGPHPGPRRGPPRSSPLPHPSLRDPITADKRH